MRRFLLLIACASLILAGCAKNSDFEALKNRVDSLEGQRITSIEGQISNISESITALQTAKGLIDKKIEELGGTDAALKAESDKLGEAIADLKTYVDELVSGTRIWAEATFATIEKMNGILTRLEVLELLCPEIQQSIADLEADIKSWVGVQLEGYATLAKLQAAIEASEAKTNEALSGVRDDIDELKSDLDTAKEQLTKDYKEAIKSAIEENHGVITKEIDDKIKAAKEAIEEDLEALEQRVESLEKRMGLMEGKIATIEEQIENIYQTIADLEELQTSMGEQFDEDLAQAIKDLKEYADGLADGTKDWAEATFATLDVMSDVLTRLEALEKKVPSLEQAISDLETNIKDWVGVQLEGYVTLAKLESDLKSLEGRLGSDITNLRNSLNGAKAQLTEDYKAAIEKAINDFAGQVTAEITSGINAAVANLQASISALEERIDALEAEMADIIGRIQSVTVVPDYLDGSVLISSSKPSTLRFEVSPVSAAKSLIATEGSKGFFSLQAVEARTKATDPASSFIDFTIESVAMDDNEEFVVVTVAPVVSLSNDSALLGRLKIEANTGKSNYVCKTSSYFPLSPHVKTPQQLSFSIPTVVWTLGTTRRIGGVYYPQDVTGAKTTVTIISSNPNIAEISSDNNILINGIGTVTITASAAESDEYFAATASYELIILPEGTLKGVFSVYNGKVRFSKGNLWTDTTVSPQTWSFETAQYATPTPTPVPYPYPGEDGNYSGNHVSHFYWLGEKYHYGSNPDMETYYYGILSDVDWGVPYCEANKLKPGTWRTLTADDLGVLLGNGRMTMEEKPAYTNFTGGVEIGGVTYYGLFLYPDDYNGEEVSGAMSWADIDDAGIVFLPASGNRDQESIYKFEKEGRYWTSSWAAGEDSAKGLTFSTNQIRYGEDVRLKCCDNALSVRLVTDVK